MMRTLCRYLKFTIAATWWAMSAILVSTGSNLDRDAIQMMMILQFFSFMIMTFLIAIEPR